MERMIEEILTKIKELDLDKQIETINQIKIQLHEISPMRNEPVDCVIWVKNDLVQANDYNPNSVAPPEMDLLKISIVADGYTQPIVSFQENNHYTVIDGFHRNRVGKEVPEVLERVKGYLPLTIIRPSQEDKGNRIASTIRHNRARGKHKIDGMSEIVLELKRRNWSDKKIGRELGMQPDEVLRLAQITGLKEMFKDKEFSQAWEVEDSIINETDSLEIEEEAKP
jgi:ParB-like chromosome segregation protein Spo0J